MKVIICRELAAIRGRLQAGRSVLLLNCLLNNWFGIALTKGHENDNSNNSSAVIFTHVDDDGNMKMHVCRYCVCSSIRFALS